ncbi:MAG: ABC transporter permease [Candidatus Helarchaeota archaeon]
MQVNELNENDEIEFQNVKAISGIQKLGLVIKYEWLKHYRKKRLYLTLILSMSFLLLLNILLPYLLAPSFEFFTFPPEDPLEFLATGSFPLLGQFFWFILIFLAIFFGSDSISAEYENRTGLLLFPNPIKRETIVIGKYLSSILMSSLVITIYYFTSWGFTFLFYGMQALDVFIGLSWSFGITLLINAGLIATTFLLSSILNKSLVTGLFVFFLFMMIMPIISQSLMMGNIEAWYLISYISDLITSIMAYPVNRFGQVTIPGPNPITMYQITPDVLTSLITVLIGYILIPLIVTMIISRRKEI